MSQIDKENKIKKIAILELNKSGGSGTCDNEDLLNILIRDINFIKKEIEIINPNLIISGIYNNRIVNRLFSNTKWVPSGYTIKIGKWNGY